ncbi:MAG: hypothetical protein KF756_06570 [Acidobacteria bacterium]|nr:hypothetical protein [Acidobacteriota bacterium]
MTSLFAAYVVTQFDFPTVMDDKYDLNARFDLARETQARSLKARVMSDAEFYFGEHYGRSLVLEAADKTLSTRMFVVGPRLFTLTVGTVGKLSTQSSKLRLANQTRIDRFFNSFAVTSIPTAISTAVELPADFQTSVADGHFYSQFFGLKIQVPDKWVVLETEQAEMILEVGKDALKSTKPGLVEHLSDKNTRVIGAFGKNSVENSTDGTFFIMMAERLPYPNLVPSALAASALKFTVDQKDQLIESPTNVQFDGIDFYWLEKQDKKTKLFQRMYLANVKGIGFEISLTYKNRADLEIMLKALASMKFGKAALQTQQ